MKRLTRTFVRPHTEIPFYVPRQEFVDHVTTTYVDTGKCTKFREKSYLDDDALVLQLVSEWDESMCEENTIEELFANDSMWNEERALEDEWNVACEIVCITKEITDF